MGHILTLRIMAEQNPVMKLISELAEIKKINDEKTRKYATWAVSKAIELIYKNPIIVEKGAIIYIDGSWQSYTITLNNSKPELYWFDEKRVEEI